MNAESFKENDAAIKEVMLFHICAIESGEADIFCPGNAKPHNHPYALELQFAEAQLLGTLQSAIRMPHKHTHTSARSLTSNHKRCVN